MNNINDYGIDNKMANEPEMIDLLNHCYRQHFPDVIEISRPEDKERQTAGIDVIIKCQSIPDPIFIDEKIRRHDYGDILLEEYSDYYRKIPGWLLSNKRTHYIAFVWLDSKKILLMPYGSLRKAFLENRESWIAKHLRIFAENNGYETSSFKIPKPELFDAFWRSSWITW